jgi:uncharacterized protein involved in exopolysaccharide biosynthesis
VTDLKSLDLRTGRQEPPDLLGAPYPLYPGDDSITLLDCARLFYRERGLIAIVVASVGAISVLAAWFMTPIYRSEVLLVPVSQDTADNSSTLASQLGGIAALVGGSIINPKDRSAESIATLRSRSLVTDFIRAQNLKPELFSAKWDKERKSWRDPQNVPTDLDAYAVFDGQIRTVNIDRRSGLVSLRVEWTDRRLAATWANGLVTAVNERRRQETIREAQQTIKYLQLELGRTNSIEVQQALYRLIESNSKTIAVANAREDYAFRVIDPAVPAESSVRPRRTLIVAVGLVLGLLLAITIVLARKAWERLAAAPTV